MASDGEMPSDAAMAAPGSMPGIPVTQYHRDLVVAFFASNSCLCVLALSILSWRIYTKLQPGFKLGADDGFIIVGFVRTKARRATPMRESTFMLTHLELYLLNMLIKVIL